MALSLSANVDGGKNKRGQSARARHQALFNCYRAAPDPRRLSHSGASRVGAPKIHNPCDNGSPPPSPLRKSKARPPTRARAAPAPPLTSFGATHTRSVRVLINFSLSLSCLLRPTDADECLGQMGGRLLIPFVPPLFACAIHRHRTQGY